MNSAKKTNPFEDIPVFRIDGGELYYLAKDVYRLNFNQLSSFWGQPEGGVKLSEDSYRQAEGEEFKKMTAVLAEPDLHIAFRCGGVSRPYEAFAVLSKSGTTGPLSSAWKTAKGPFRPHSLTVLIPTGNTLPPAMPRRWP